jgi:hypothetical protein
MNSLQRLHEVRLRGLPPCEQPKPLRARGAVLRPGSTACRSHSSIRRHSGHTWPMPRCDAADAPRAVVREGGIRVVVAANLLALPRCRRSFTRSGRARQGRRFRRRGGSCWTTSEGSTGWVPITLVVTRSTSNCRLSAGCLSRFRASPTADEDAADAYAGRFLARYGYSLQSVVQYLQSLPYSPGDFQHSDGPDRARTVADAYATVRGGYAGAPVREAPQCRMVTEWVPRVDYITRMVTQTVPCQHCGCNAWGQCGCLHAADLVQVPQQVPVTRQVPVSRQVCN